MSLMISQPQIYVSDAPRATASFDPPIVRPGELTFYRVVFNALEESVDWPDKITAPPQLELRPGAHGQLLQMAGASLEPRTSFNYRVRASGPGTFTVPEFTVMAYGKPVKVPAAQLEVVSATPANARPPLQLTLELPVTNFYVGQAAAARIVMPGLPGIAVQGLGAPQLMGQGILVDQGSARQRVEMTTRDGKPMPVYIYETTLTPIITGRLTVYAQGFTAGNNIPGFGVVSGAAPTVVGPPQYTLLESDPIELNVRPLPTEGELPGFTGAIGSFSVSPPTLANNVLRVGDPVKLTVAVINHSDAPFARLLAPPPPRTRDWQVFAATDYAPPQAILQQRPPPFAVLGSRTPPEPLQGVVTFHYTLVPLTETARATPPIPFSCFDPKRGTYIDLTIPSIPVTVRPGTVPADLAALNQPASAAGQSEKELVLQGLAASRGRTAASLVPPQQQAWFPFVQLAPAAVFFGLWNWDRRRRYLEQHPDIVLRRRARRALRRQRRILRRAARMADASGFATAAVDAVRVACAPHYPAEPHALVGADVLPLLPEPERCGRSGDVIRRFFAATDATRFSTAPPDPADLLALRPELENVLRKLEERL